MHWYEFDEEEVQQALLKYEREEGRKEGRKEGRDEGRKEGRDETLISSIRNLMVTLNLTAQQAMEALRIPADEQKKYLAMI